MYTDDYGQDHYGNEYVDNNGETWIGPGEQQQSQQPLYPAQQVQQQQQPRYQPMTPHPSGVQHGFTDASGTFYGVPAQLHNNMQQQRQPAMTPVLQAQQQQAMSVASQQQQQVQQGPLVQGQLRQASTVNPRTGDKKFEFDIAAQDFVRR